MKGTPDPYAVMALGTVLPGAGHVWLGLPRRGLSFVLFIILLGTATILTAPDQATPIGRIAGGLFVWAMSIMDAYRIARFRTRIPKTPHTERRPTDSERGSLLP